MQVSYNLNEIETINGKPVFTGEGIGLTVPYSEREGQTEQRFIKLKEGVRRDKEGRIYIPPGYEFTPVSIDNLPDKYLNALGLFSIGTKKNCFKALRISKSILALKPVNELVRNIQNNIRNATFPAHKRMLGEEVFNEMWNKILSVHYIEDNQVIYKNLKYNFLLKYPKGWRVIHAIEYDPERNNAAFQIESPPLKDRSGKEVRPSIGVMAEKVSLEMDVTEYSELWEERLKNLRSSISKSTYEKNGIRFIYDGHWEGKEFKGEDIFFVKDGCGYYLNFTTKPSVFEETKGQLQEILKSFTIY